MHIKRKTTSQFWPTAKTGTKYMAVPLHHRESSVPIVVFVRDVLALVKNMKEMEKTLREKKISVNGKIIKEPNYPIIFGDSIAISSIGKYFKVGLKGKRFDLLPVSEKEADVKILRVVNKKILPGKKIQVNFDNGQNLISNEKIETDNFVEFNNKSKKIVKIISLDKGVEVVVIKGKHCGKEGKLIQLSREGENEIAHIKTNHGDLKVNSESIYVK